MKKTEFLTIVFYVFVLCASFFGVYEGYKFYKLKKTDILKEIRKDITSLQMH